MTTLVDYIMNLFRDPVEAQSFVADPDQALNNAGLPNVTAAQLNAVAATATPAGVAFGGGDPVVGLQRAVSDHHNIASPFSPVNAFAPQTNTEFASRNNTDLLSNNDTRLLSPETNAVSGGDTQQGGVNLDFSDMTFGDRTQNTASDGSVINTGTAGDIDATNVRGDGNVVGDGNENVNTGDVEAGAGSNVNIGEGDIDDRGTTVTGGGDNIQGNEGPVINDVDTSGGSGGGASGGAGGGGLIGGGDGGNAAGGAGGSGGAIIINDNDTTSVGGNQTTTEVGGDVSGSGGIDNSVDNSVDASVDNSGQDNSVDNSTDNSGQVNTDVDVSTNVDAGLL